MPKKVRQLLIRFASSLNFPTIAGMAASPGKFLLLRPEQLVLPLAFPQREGPASLSPLKNSLRENGVLTPLIVRTNSDGFYLVLDGRRRLKAVWELLGEGAFPEGGSLPCFVVASPTPQSDLKFFLLLNQAAGLSAGDAERIQAAMEEAAESSA